jgi:hypothetical protein
MKPTIEGFTITNEINGFGVTTIYDLFSLGKPKLLYVHPTKELALAHQERCFDNAMREYQWCKKEGCSFPYND